VLYPFYINDLRWVLYHTFFILYDLPWKAFCLQQVLILLEALNIFRIPVVSVFSGAQYRLVNLPHVAWFKTLEVILQTLCSRVTLHNKGVEKV